MNNDERIWLNNQLFQFSDERYGTNGTMSVTATLSTIDSKDFSPLRLNISIGNSEHNRKTCWLSFSQVVELEHVINEVMSPDNYDNIYNKGNPADIERKYSNKMFRLLFKKSKQDLNDCVLVGIYSNENDRNVTILTMDFFRSFYSILTQFKNNYFTIENMIISRYMRSIELEELKSINSSLKTIPRIFEDLQDTIERKLNKNININSQVNNGKENDNNDSILEENNYSNEPENNNKEDTINNEFSSTIEEFDNFVNDNIDSITLPEIDKIENEQKSETTDVGIHSDFIDKVLNNDIGVLCTKSKNIILEDCKILSFKDLIETELGVNPLEEINDTSLKSCIYLSELNIRQFLKQYYFHGMEYPRTCNMIRSEVSNPSTFNKNLSYSLFMIHAYLKNYSGKMESRINDQLASKTDFYINLRLFSDIFTYSFLINENPDVIKSNVKSLYNHYSNKGFFSKFDKNLEDYNLEPITINDIEKFVTIGIEKLPKTAESTKLQDSMYENNSAKLPSENKYSIEQIIKQIVDLEILHNFKLDIDENAEKFGIDLNKIDKDILTIFKNNKKINRKKEKQTNLYRYIKYYDDEIPDSVKDDFYNYIENLGYKDFDFVNSQFQLTEFGENIIKGLYQWNNLNDKKEKYTDFFYKCSETILNKNDILTREQQKSDYEESEDWGDLFK